MEEAGKKYVHAIKYVDPTDTLYQISQKSPKPRDLVAIMQAYQLDETMSCFDERVSHLFSDNSLTFLFQEFPKSITKLSLPSFLFISPNAFGTPLPTLSELDLSESNANDELIKQINRNFKNLKILRLLSTKIKDLPFSESMEKLEELILSESKKLSNVALINIGNYCPQLKCLHLSGTNVIEDPFLTMLKGCKEINNLDISNCKRLGSDLVILSISRSLPDLHSLNLGFLGFSPQSFSSIPANCKKLLNIRLPGTPST